MNTSVPNCPLWVYFISRYSSAAARCCCMRIGYVVLFLVALLSLRVVSQIRRALSIFAARLHLPRAAAGFEAEGFCLAVIFSASTGLFCWCLRIYCRTCGRHSADHHSYFAPVEVLFNSTVPARIQVRVSRNPIPLRDCTAWQVRQDLPFSAMCGSRLLCQVRD